MIVWKRFYTFDFWEFTCTADVNVIWYWWISWTWYHWVTQCRWSTWGQCPDNQVALILDCTMHGGPRADMHRGLIIMVCEAGLLSLCHFFVCFSTNWTHFMSRRRKGSNVNEIWNNFMARVNQTATGAPSIGRLLWHSCGWTPKQFFGIHIVGR